MCLRHLELYIEAGGSCVSEIDGSLTCVFGEFAGCCYNDTNQIFDDSPGELPALALHVTSRRCTALHCIASGCGGGVMGCATELDDELVPEFVCLPLEPDTSI